MNHANNSSLSDTLNIIELKGQWNSIKNWKYVKGYDISLFMNGIYFIYFDSPSDNSTSSELRLDIIRSGNFIAVIYHHLRWEYSAFYVNNLSLFMLDPDVNTGYSGLFCFAVFTVLIH